MTHETPDAAELWDKQKAADELGVSTRWLERKENREEYGLTVTHRTVGRTTQAFFVPQQIKDTKDLRDRGVKLAPVSRPKPEPETFALALPDVQSGELIRQLAAASVAPLVAELRAVADPWPVWMTRAQALELAGLPPSWLAAGARKKELPFVGWGPARRIHRDELRAFAERVKDSEYLARLLEKKKKVEVAGTIRG